MDVESLMDELEDILEACWRLPMSGGRVVINSNEVKRIIEDLRLRLPKELVQAKKIVADRSQIIEDARLEAETMLKVSEEKVKIMVSKDELVRSAQIAANNIVGDAKSKAKELKTATNDYAEKTMQQLDQVVASALAEIRKARQSLRSSDFTAEA